MQRIKLSDHFTYSKLVRFVMPSIIMLVFTSIYCIVDGFFVSNFTNKTAFAALNLIFPLIMILGSVGFMLGAGGNAVVSKALGEKDNERANRIFSMLVYVTIAFGIILSLFGIAVARPVAKLFAANEKGLTPAERAQLIDYCVVYVRIILAVLPAFMLQNAFQGFFVTAEKARLGLYVTIIAGVGNIIFDVLFVAVFKWGLVGAALATALNQLIGGIIPILYFSRKNDSLLRLGKANLDLRVLGRVCLNGMSELMTNISLSAVTILYNAQLMKLIGIAGVSAYGVMQYIGFIFIGVFIGYAVGSAPIIGYHYGANNTDELKNIFKKSLTILFTLGFVMTAIAIIFAKAFSCVFVSSDKELLDITTNGMRIYSLCYLAAGVNIFGSAFFTALSNGGVSLLISFARTLVFQVISILILPIFFQINGVWASMAVAEGVGLLLTMFLFFQQRKKYKYL